MSCTTATHLNEFCAVRYFLSISRIVRHILSVIARAELCNSGSLKNNLTFLKKCLNRSLLNSLPLSAVMLVILNFKLDYMA
jgi:hypothetical protein